MRLFSFALQPAAVALGAALALGACAPLPPQAPAVGRAQLALPHGDWADLGISNEALRLLPEVGATVQLQTRALGWRGAGDELLAVLVVQTHSSGTAPAHSGDPTLWSGTCPPHKDTLVEDYAQGSATRVDCLRYKRVASSYGWMEQHQPQLARWVQEHALPLRAPYAHVSYRYAAQSGAFIVVQALVHERLLTPATRSNAEFLQAGRPGLEWSRALARAARTSTTALNGAFEIPPLPFPTAATAPRTP